MPRRNIEHHIHVDVIMLASLTREQRESYVATIYREAAEMLARQILDSQLATCLVRQANNRRALEFHFIARVDQPRGNWLTAEEVQAALPEQPQGVDFYAGPVFERLDVTRAGTVGARPRRNPLLDAAYDQFVQPQQPLSMSNDPRLLAEARNLNSNFVELCPCTACQNTRSLARIRV